MLIYVIKLLFIWSNSYAYLIVRNQRVTINNTLKELICVPARLKKSVILPRNPVYSNHPRYLKFQNFPSGTIISYLCNLGRLYATKILWFTSKVGRPTDDCIFLPLSMHIYSNLMKFGSRVCKGDIWNRAVHNLPWSRESFMFWQFPGLLAVMSFKVIL